MRFKFRFTIALKLITTFAVLLLAVLYTSWTTYNTLDVNMKADRIISNTYTPSAQLLNKLQFIITNSKMLIKNWVNDQKDTPDKARLREIHNKGWQEVRNPLDTLVIAWEPEDQLIYNNLVLSIDTLFSWHKEIMSKLNTFESYNNIMAKFMVIPRVDETGDVILLTDRILIELGSLVERQEAIVEKSNALMQQRFNEFQNLIVWIGIGLVAIVILAAIWLIRILVTPINYIKEIILRMGKGIMPKKELEIRSDEIGEMAKALNLLVDGLRKTSKFSLEIGDGNFDSKFNPLSSQDDLGNSLIIMRENLKNAAIEEEKRKKENMERNWAAQGIAKFSEILRQHNDNIEELGFEVISNLVKYLDANIGGFFIIDDSDENDKHLTLIASYAYTRKKYLKKRVEIGENIVGQCFLEGETVFMNDIPQDYIKITSGLGEDNPKCLLVVPLKLQNEIFGVVEIASFNRIEKYQIEFVERIGETVSSTISTVKVNINTANLLSESQEKSKRLAEQEEEMRQTIEQMQANHQRMLKDNENEKLRIISNLDAIISSTLTVEFNLNGECIKVNDLIIKTLNIRPESVVGKHHSEFIPKEIISSLEYQNFWTELNNGISKKGMNRYLIDDQEFWFVETFIPVRNPDGAIQKVLAMFSDVTKLKEREEKWKRQFDTVAQELDKTTIQ